MDGRIAEIALARQQIILDEREGERRVAPTVLEDAVDAVEEEEDAVHLGDGKLDCARAERFDGDGIRPR